MPCLPHKTLPTTKLTYFSMMASRFVTYSSKFATTVEVDVPEIVISIRTDPNLLSSSYHRSLVNSRSNVDKSIAHLKIKLRVYVVPSLIMHLKDLLSEHCVLVTNHDIQHLRTVLVENVQIVSFRPFGFKRFWNHLEMR